MKPTNGMDRAQFHDKAWALWQEKALDDAKLPKLSIHAIRTLWNVLYDAMPVECQASPNAAGEEPFAWIRASVPGNLSSPIAYSASTELLKNPKDGYLPVYLAPVQAAAPQPSALVSAISTEERAPEAFKHRRSIGTFDISKEAANAICAGIAAVTGMRVECHCIPGRVQLTALVAPASAPVGLTGERAAIKSLQEPVTVEKALLAGRIARAEVEQGGKSAAFLVNIQLTGWRESEEYAEAFSRGFNSAAAAMQRAILEGDKHV